MKESINRNVKCKYVIIFFAFLRYITIAIRNTLSVWLLTLKIHLLIFDNMGLLFIYVIYVSTLPDKYQLPFRHVVV